MEKEQQFDKSLLDLTIKERALKEREAERYLDAVEYWELPDFRYPELHIDMANDPCIAKKDDMRSIEDRAEDFLFGKTKADLLLYWQKWRKKDTPEMRYEYVGEEKGNFDKAQMFLVKNEKNNQPEIIVAFMGINGITYFPFDTGTVVAMLQKLRECDAEEPISLKAVY